MKQDGGGIACKVKPDTKHGTLSLSLIRDYRILVERPENRGVIPGRGVDLLNSEEGDGKNRPDEGK